MASFYYLKKLYTFIFGTWRSVTYDIHSLFPCRMPNAGLMPIDIVIPVIDKDIDILPLCLEGLRRNCNNIIDNIYLVAPAHKAIIDFAEQNNLVFVDEDSILGYSAKAINYTDRFGKNRSGWVFQQLLKLSGNVGHNRYYVTVDADHILMKPHTFVTDKGESVFYMSKEYYYPYYVTQKALTGQFPFQNLSYIAHKMVFDKEYLHTLHQTLELGKDMSWDRVIVDTLKHTPMGSFSEFELYGHLYPSNNKKRVLWRQKELSKGSNLTSYQELLSLYPHSLSITFPDYRKTT